MQGNRRPIIVSFSGIDGAGKSTQIRELYNRLTDAGLHVSVLAFWDDIAVLGHARGFLSHTMFRSEKGIGAPGAPVRRRDKNVQSWFMTPVRFGFYLLDGLSLALWGMKAQAGAWDVIIFDRYIYDELANLKLDRLAGRAYARCLLGLVPRPEVAYLLDAEPAQARERKPEYPLEFLNRNRAAFLTLAQIAGMTVIAPASPAEAARKVNEAIFKHVQPPVAVAVTS